MAKPPFSGADEFPAITLENLAIPDDGPFKSALAPTEGVVGLAPWKRIALTGNGAMEGSTWEKLDDGTKQMTIESSELETNEPA